MAIKQPTKSHFLLPDLGEGVAEAELISWKVQPGEDVAEHQTLAEMETDKALRKSSAPGRERSRIGGARATSSMSCPDNWIGFASTDAAAVDAEDDSSSDEDAGTVVERVGRTHHAGRSAESPRPRGKRLKAQDTS